MISFTVGHQLYNYAQQNPTSYVDPEGEIAFLAAVPYIVTGISVSLTGYEAYETVDGLASGRVTKEDLAAGYLQEKAIGIGLKAIPGIGATAGIVYGYLNKSPAGQVATASTVNPRRAGQLHETEQLAQLGLDKNNLVYRPTAEQIDSAAFKVIVGEAKYTRGGELKGTIFDSVDNGYLEIKGGSSPLNSTYQLRLQTYKSVIDDQSFTIQTTRPVNTQFQSWLDSWGVNVVRPK